MTTLERILHLLWLVDLNTTMCIGLAGRLLAGYQSKECKEAYENAEKWRRRDFEQLMSYPAEWIEAAKIIRELRRNGISTPSLERR